MHLAAMRILIFFLSSLELRYCQAIDNDSPKPMPDGVEPNCDFSHSSVGYGMWVTKQECARNTVSAPLGFQVLRMGQNILEKGRCINPREGELNEPIIGKCYAHQMDFESTFRPSLTYEKLLSMGFKPEDIPYINQIRTMDSSMPSTPSCPARIDESAALPNGHPMSIHTQEPHIHAGGLYVPQADSGYCDNIHLSAGHSYLEDLTLHPPLTTMPGMDGPTATHMLPYIYGGSSNGANPHSTIEGHFTPNIIDDQIHRAGKHEGTMENEYYCFVGKDGKKYVQRLQTDPETGYFYALSPKALPRDSSSPKKVRKGPVSGPGSRPQGVSKRPKPRQDKPPFRGRGAQEAEWHKRVQSKL